MRRSSLLLVAALALASACSPGEPAHPSRPAPSASVASSASAEPESPPEDPRAQQDRILWSEDGAATCRIVLDEEHCKLVRRYLKIMPDGPHGDEARRIAGLLDEKARARTAEADRAGADAAKGPPPDSAAARLRQSASENTWRPADGESTSCCRGHGGVRGCVSYLDKSTRRVLRALQCIDGTDSTCTGC